MTDTAATTAVDTASATTTETPVATIPTTLPSKHRFKAKDLVNAIETVLKEDGPQGMESIMSKLETRGFVAGKRLLYQYLSQYSRPGRSNIVRATRGLYSYKEPETAGATQA